MVLIHPSPGPWLCSYVKCRDDPGTLNKFLMAVLGGKIVEWILLRGRQFRTPFGGQLLYPSVIDIGDRQHTLTALAQVPGGRRIVRSGLVCKDHPTGNHRIVCK